MIRLCSEQAMGSPGALRKRTEMKVRDVRLDTGAHVWRTFDLSRYGVEHVLVASSSNCVSNGDSGCAGG